MVEMGIALIDWLTFALPEGKLFVFIVCSRYAWLTIIVYLENGRYRHGEPIVEHIVFNPFLVIIHIEIINVLGQENMKIFKIDIVAFGTVSDP